MPYGLIRRVSSSSAFLPISEEMFRSLEQAMNGLYGAMCIEEIFDVVIENHLEFENALLEAAVRQMVTSEGSIMDFRTGRSLFSRRLMNLLSACRSYKDHTRRHVQHLFGEKASISLLLDELREDLKATSLSYRIFEAFRNHVQHRGSSIHSVTWDARAPNRANIDKWQYAVIPHIQLKHLRLDVQFSREILSEMEGLGETIDLRPILRDYISKLGELHEAVRNKMAPAITKWETAIGKAFDDFAQQFPDEARAVVLSAVHEEEGSDSSESVSVFKDFITIRTALTSKNGRLVNLAGRFATNEAEELGSVLNTLPRNI